MSLFKFSRIQESLDMPERWDVLHKNLEKNARHMQLPTDGE